MRELSVEEKAKRYDEAIVKLRGMMPNWERLSYNGKTFLQDLIHILPELKESEDERMRNAAINACKYMVDNFENSTKQYEDAIAWLEKRVEQETVSKVKIGEKYRCSNSVRYTCFQTGKVYEVKDSFDAAMISLCSDCFVLVDDSVEQKSADITDEWIEEYWQHEKVNNPYSYNKGDEIQFDYQGFVSFCKKYCQKPAWSEEEVEIIDWLVASFDCLKIPTDTFYQSKVRPFLISLRNKIQPIINEWSGEDEEMLTKFLHKVEVCDLLTNRESVWVTKRLKSLRPQNRWKPSEEMLEALYRAVPQNVKEMSEDEMLLDKLYQGLKYGRVLSEK